MKKHVGIEEGLKPVREYLKNEGYNVSEFSEGKMNDTVFFNNFDVVVITGQDKNLFGMENTLVKSPVISADGMTPEEIKKQIEKNTMY